MNIIQKMKDKLKLDEIKVSPKKFPYYFALLSLTLGASLVIGFLSFGGMFALYPILPLAFAAFGLSVAYEGEIYLQNIKGALKKIIKPYSLNHFLAKEYLLNHFPKDTGAADCPQFFRDYEIQLKLLSKFGHKKLTKASRKQKRQVELTISDMEKWFALQLLKTKNNSAQTEYAKSLQLWLASHEQDQVKVLLAQRKKIFKAMMGISVFAGSLMLLGASYLIVESLMVIPFFAAIPFAIWPAFVVPMAIFAGVFFALGTYNAITDMINNKTIQKWYHKFREYMSQGFTKRNVLMGFTAAILLAFALALTIFSAGTWWTVASNATPIFNWMKNIPSYVMGIINPIVIGIASLVFNLQNTSESLEMIDDILPKSAEPKENKQNVIIRMGKAIVNWFTRSVQAIKDFKIELRSRENWLQIFNPFRIILKLTVTPLRILLFLGHLMSIALTADRMPGVPQILAALIAFISEGFEDVHYFVDGGHDHEKHDHSTEALLKERLDPSHAHSHEKDIPTRVLRALSTPIYLLASAWDQVASKLNKRDEGIQRPVLSFDDAWDKQRGNSKEKEVLIKDKQPRPSTAWQKEHIISRIEKHQSEHLGKVFIGSDLVHRKVARLHTIQQEIRLADDDQLQEVLEKAKQPSILNKHRLFNTEKPTHTQTMIEQLGERVGLVR